MKKKVAKVDTFSLTENSATHIELLFDSLKTRQELVSLSTDEQDQITDYFCEALTKAHKNEQEERVKALLQKAKTLFSESDYEDYRNQTWCFNHKTIRCTIAKYVAEYGALPSSYDLSIKTGLSRYTISKHLKEFASHPMQTEEMEKFKYMSSRLLGTLLKLGLSGDVRAAKVYLDNVLPKSSAPGYVKNQQNNFISINGITLDEKTVSALPPERLNQIADIIKSATAEPAEQVEVIS